MSMPGVSIALIQEYAVNGETFAAVGPIMSWSDMGFMRYPITFCALMVLSLATRSAWQTRTESAESLVPSTTDGVLFWGAYASVLGVLGTVLGMAIAAQAVEAVGEVHTRLVWGGVKVALSTTIYGLLVLLVSGLAWFGLRQWQRKRLVGA